MFRRLTTYVIDIIFEIANVLTTCDIPGGLEAFDPIACAMQITYFGPLFCTEGSESNDSLRNQMFWPPALANQSLIPEVHPGDFLRLRPKIATNMMQLELSPFVYV